MKNYESLLKPVEIEVEGKTFCISRFTATDGREIVSNYFSSNVPKIGNYKVSKETMLKLMSFVAAKNSESNYVVLQNETLVNSFLNDMQSPWEALGKIEIEMLKYNCTFFQNGRISTFLGDIALILQQKSSEILTPLLEKLLQKGEQL